MAEPNPVPTLFELSLAALIAHVKNKKLKISPDEIPLCIHNTLWETSTVLDLRSHVPIQPMDSQIALRVCMDHLLKSKRTFNLVRLVFGIPIFSIIANFNKNFFVVTPLMLISKVQYGPRPCTKPEIYGISRKTGRYTMFPIKKENRQHCKIQGTYSEQHTLLLYITTAFNKQNFVIRSKKNVINPEKKHITSKIDEQHTGWNELLLIVGFESTLDGSGESLVTIGFCANMTKMTPR
ncbi:hypothetical protein CAEBREN_23821 [Caenorhabditis brenneri]|uniref:Uncharacterized protein n=1 Tax=Caenorhabditis brenneri TaxID=135651 RepID=G0P0L4_CAEBE|nr:hypothetical protein CAEBREN_23821 [Caenorhabditis brenneri]